MVKNLLIIIFAVTLASCGSFGLYDHDKGEVVASVGNKKLYSTDLKHLFNGDITTSDSAAIAQNYIESWLKNEVKIAAAEASMSTEQNEIDILVEEYRKSLIIYRYEDQVVKQQLDTITTPSQISDYYNQNRDNFRLVGPVVKGIIVRIPAKMRLNVKFEKLFKDNSEEGQREFFAICGKNNYRLTDFTQNWTDFSTVITNLPFTNNNFDEFLKSKKYYEVEDDQYKYLLKIISYRPTNDFAPMESESTNIRKIILNSRRAELVRNLEDSLMNIAKNNKTIQIKP